MFQPVSPISWVNREGPGRVGVMACPKGGDLIEDCLKFWREDGCDVLVSLIETDEAGSLGLAREGEVAKETGMEFVHHPVPDFGIPESSDAALDLARGLAAKVREGHAVAIHCRAGVGRAPSIAACVLIALGETGERALDLISDARGFRVPETAAQRAWVLKAENALSAPSQD